MLKHNPLSLHGLWSFELEYLERKWNRVWSAVFPADLQAVVTKPSVKEKTAEGGGYEEDEDVEEEV